MALPITSINTILIIDRLPRDKIISEKALSSAVTDNPINIPKAKERGIIINFTRLLMLKLTYRSISLMVLISAGFSWSFEITVF